MLHLVLLRGPVLAEYSKSVKHNLLTGRLVYNDETNEVTQVQGRIKLVAVDGAEIKQFLITHDANGFLRKTAAAPASAKTVAELEAMLAAAKLVEAQKSVLAAESEAHSVKESTELALAQQKLADAADAKIAATEAQPEAPKSLIVTTATESKRERKFREAQARKLGIVLDSTLAKA
jgi:hypothetical protein